MKGDTMNKITISVAVAMTMLMAGCTTTGVNKEETFNPETHALKQVSLKEQEVPVWYLAYPRDEPTKIYAAATAKSDDMQFSMDKAVHDAKVLMADKLSAKVGAEMKRYIADNGSGGMGVSIQETELVSKSGFKNTDVSGYVVENKSVFIDGKHYRSYVLISLDNVESEVVVETESVNEVSAFSEKDHTKAQLAFEGLK